jgi:hypothetical protein
MGRRNPGPEPSGVGNDPHQISPRLIRENFRLGFFDCGINGGRAPAVDPIEIFRDSLRISRSHVGMEGLGIKSAAGFLELSGQTLGSLKQRVGNRNCDFHVFENITSEFSLQGESVGRPSFYKLGTGSGSPPQNPWKTALLLDFQRLHQLQQVFGFEP